MKPSPLLIRIITTIIAGIPIVICTTLGSIFFLILMIVLTMLSINEFYYMVEARSPKNYFLGILANSLAVILVSSAFFKETNPLWFQWVTAGLALGLILFWLKELSLKRLILLANEYGLMARAVFYIGFSYTFLILIRESANGVGLYWMFYLITSVWLNDGMAYIFGIKFGQHRLSPDISPKKSIEGAIAGLTFCTLWSLFLGTVMGIPIFHSIILGLLVSSLAQAGDLTESLLKREMNVKDSGVLLPGHGGVLDRMDSFILTAPVLYYYTTFFNLL